MDVDAGMFMELDAADDGLSPGRKVSGLKFIPSEEIMYPRISNWNSTHPFCQSRVESVRSNLGDTDQPLKMSAAVDAPNNDDSRCEECPLYSSLLLDLSQDKDESPALDNADVNDEVFDG